MKKALLSLIILCFSISLQSQSIKGIVIAGMNISQVNGDDIYGFNKIGANLGVGAFIPIYHNWSFSIETLYNQKGSWQRIQNPNNNIFNGEYKLELNYVDVPILVHYTDNDFITGGVGISWGRLIKVYEKAHTFDIGWDLFDVNMPYNRNDWNIIADVRLRVWRQFQINFRYQYSILKIRALNSTPVNNNQFSRQQYNNYLSIRLLWLFNESFEK